jgi:hypothetical protein
LDRHARFRLICSPRHSRGFKVFNYFVDVYALTDGAYLVCRCPLRSDGTWRSETLVTATEDGVTYSYWETIPVSAGFKEFRLTLPDGTVDYPYARFEHFKVRLYAYTDAEYLTGESPIWDMGGGRHIFYRRPISMLCIRKPPNFALISAMNMG